METFNMKKIFGLIIISLLLSTISFAGVKKGKGDVKLSERALNHFIKYIRAKKGNKPLTYILSSNGNWSFYWYCPYAGGCSYGNYEPTIKDCEEATGVDCGLFARRYTIVWKNGINPGKGKASTIKSKWSDAEIRAKLTEFGFLGGNTSSTKKTTSKKTVKKKVKGERSIALSWEGYEDLIIGTLGFEESDDGESSLSLKLPNNDGNCEGSYSLLNGGIGTWQIACTNKLGAGGTLKWLENGSVTGNGRDNNDKKVKFTVAKRS